MEFGQTTQAATQAATQAPTQAPKMEQGPLDPGQLVPTLLMMLIAAAGGFVAFYRKWKEGHVRAFNITELMGELFVSGLCGIGAYWVCKGFEVNPWLTAAAVGMVGHMGSRAVFMAENWVGKKIGVDVPKQATPVERIP
jgi:hypothetical protein